GGAQLPGVALEALAQGNQDPQRGAAISRPPVCALSVGCGVPRRASLAAAGVRSHGGTRTERPERTMTMLERWNPISEFDRMLDEVDRRLSETMGRSRMLQ